MAHADLAQNGRSEIYPHCNDTTNEEIQDLKTTKNCIILPTIREKAASIQDSKQISNKLRPDQLKIIHIQNKTTRRYKWLPLNQKHVFR